MIPMQKPEQHDCERNEAVRVLGTVAGPVADLTPDEIERKMASALAEVRARNESIPGSGLVRATTTRLNKIPGSGLHSRYSAAGGV